MAIKCNFEYKGSTYNQVEFRITRIFGGKFEGNYNAIFSFVNDGQKFVEENFLGSIAIGVPWADENPYPTLYKRMEEIITSGGFNIQPEVKEVVSKPTKEVDLAPVKKEVLESVKEEKPKKTRTKKVTKNGTTSAK